LERFVEANHGVATDKALARLVAMARGEGIEPLDEERLAEVLPPLLAAQGAAVLAAEAVRRAMRTDLSGRSSDQLRMHADQLAALERAEQDRKDEVGAKARELLKEEYASYEERLEGERQRADRERREAERQRREAERERERQIERELEEMERREEERAARKRMAVWLLSALTPFLLCGLCVFSCGLYSFGTPKPEPKAGREQPPAPAAPRSDALDGEWQLIAQLEDGQAPDADFIKDRTITFQSNKWAIRDRGEVTAEGTFSIDRSRRPARLVLSSVEAGLPHRLIGVIQVEDGVLTYCLAKDGVYPDKFESKQGDRRTLAQYSKKTK
jgi:uncharacterized protein (TIGR03067 family)